MFLDMFKHEGKFTRLTGKKHLKSYQNLYLMLRKKQNSGELPIHPDGDYRRDKSPTPADSAPALLGSCPGRGGRHQDCVSLSLRRSGCC